MSSELTTILDEVRAQIARGDEPDAGLLERRIKAHPEHDRALAQLNRLLAVHRAKRSLAAPPTPPPAPRPAPRSNVYRAKPTVSATMAVRARAQGDVVVLEWERPGVTQWDARISERPDARSNYEDREQRTLDGPRVELQLGDRPQRVHIAGRNAAGRVVARALVSGLTSANWNQRWQQRPSAS
jgi:hypothetical protein